MQKAKMLYEKFLQTKVPQGSNENGRTTRNTLYLWPRRIERLRVRLPFRNGWKNAARGYAFWRVRLVMGCCWWPPSSASVVYARYVSGGDH